MKRKLLVCLALLTLALSLSACFISSGEPSYPIELGESALFAQKQLEDAVSLIQREFRSWKGCEMHAITYAGDHYSTLDNLIWLNELAESKGMGVEFTECALFLTDFHSPTEDNNEDGWLPDYEFTDWQWWLGCTAKGQMVLMDFGY
ncbi:MAG: hypothetical protein IKH34_10605 [Oscillospiraceae bacterium]|nr:hypothetical protein [Oscillospiraceae bacterium]